MRRTAVAVLALAALLGWPGGTVAAEEGQGASRTTWSGATEQDALRFRESFGLRSDVEYVRATFLEPDAYLDEPYGIPC